MPHRFFKKYAAGTDTRNQFTTPPDARQVADLVDAYSSGTSGGQLIRDGFFSTTLTLSNATWTVVPVTSGAIVMAHPGWNTTNNCWGGSGISTWFNDFTYVWVDINFAVSFSDWAGGNTNSQSYVQFRTRTTAAGSTVTYTVLGSQQYQTRHAASLPMVVSGTVAVRLQVNHVVEMRLHQTSGTSMTGVTAQWGPRPVDGYS